MKSIWFSLFASYCVAATRETEVAFDSEEVKGSIQLSQASAGGPTTITVKLEGLEEAGNKYHVHSFPVSDGCGSASTGGHFNPFGVDVKLCASTTDKAADCEVGDLSGKHGLLEGTTVDETYKDTNLPLHGANSILGRSIVIHKSNGDRWVCGTIPYAYLKHPLNTVVTRFTAPLSGSITFTQLADVSTLETTILVDVAYADSAMAETSGHKIHVHELKLAAAGNCNSAGGHYNPEGVDVAICAETSGAVAKAGKCEVGDLSGKHGMISVPGKAFFTDLNLPLTGKHSVAGRSIVIHDADGSPSRLGCGDNVAEGENADAQVSGVTASRMTSWIVASWIVAMLAMLHISAITIY